MNFICFDTEDNSKELRAQGLSGFLKKVTQIAAIAGNGETFYCPGNAKAFLKWILQRKEKFIYSLNIQYDLGALFADELDVLDTVLVGGRMIRATWKNKVFVDVFNIWPMSVKALAPAFGMTKLETNDMATDKEYVFQDTRIIHAAMCYAWEFAGNMGLDSLPATLGGLCVKLWQHWGGENCHDSNELSRECLFGGRVELFKPRNDSDAIAWTDINSLYPSVMRNQFPGRLEDCETKLKDFGVAEITIQLPKTELALLPFRNKDGRIFYPYGKVRGCWTVAEINAATTRGAKIVKVHRSMGTNECQRPYGTFVARLYEMRLAATSDAARLFYKLLMNNLYGRLGTSGVIGRTVHQTPKNKFDGVPFGSKVLVQYSLPLSEETNWSHAAYVTAYGRLELLRHMELIGAQNMIYADTDSCIFDCPSRQLPFAIGKGLGEMKLESWETQCQTFAPKLYFAGKKYKAKGVPQRLAQQYIETGKAEFDLPFKYRESIRFYDRDNSHKLAVWRPVEKVRRSGYDRKNLIGNRFFPCKVVSV